MRLTKSSANWFGLHLSWFWRACAFLHLILRFAYHITLDFWYYAIGFLIAFPPFLYAVKIIKLFRDNRQDLVFFVGLKAIAINSGNLICIAALRIRAQRCADRRRNRTNFYGLPIFKHRCS